MTAVLDGTTVLRADRVVFRPQAGRRLVYRPATDQLYLVPELAERIVTACDGTRQLDAVLASIGITQESAGPDGLRKVLALVAGLIDRDVLRVVDPAAQEERSG